MKTKSYLFLVYIIAITLSLASCFPKKDIAPINAIPATATSSMEALHVPLNFDYKTTIEIKFAIQTLDNDDKPIKGIPIVVYSFPEQQLLFKSITPKTGLLQINRKLPTYIQKVLVRTEFIGLPQEFIVDVVNNTVELTFGGKNPVITASMIDNALLLPNLNSSRDLNKLNQLSPTITNFGTWNANGVPHYLEKERDLISSEFLSIIDANLSENVAVTKANPKYLSASNVNTLNITEDADVWITFVHESASLKNTLGFYTFDLKNPPSKITEVSSLNIIFPNISYVGNGGGLNSGDKVKIGRFKAGTGIGFALLVNAFTSKSTVESNNNIYYSHDVLNVETVAENKRHIIMLNDPKTNRLIFSFEDTNRQNISYDQDFNDAIFFASSDPVRAVNKDHIPSIIESKNDVDIDGISDLHDEYPNDASRAMNNFTPSKNTYSSLAYEDLWPFRGDYDMNDLVVNYQFQEVMNANNQIVELKAKIYVKSCLASIINGWGFQLPIPSSSIASVTGQSLLHGVIINAANGTETGQKYATVIAFDNAFKQVIGNKADTLNLRIRFTSPINKSDLGTAPFNPFMFQKDNRGIEIHLANFAPTQKANLSVLGTSDDNSVTAKGIYYINKTGLPWALNLNENFNFPKETQKIINGYLHFQEWVESGGSKYPDWYLDKPGYRNNSLLSNEK
ncbi:LruC domain-containing protein [Emticicia sp. SJ17W-69]|uniref:LruC domain-containing protein n=1 Tax=Emticicia sp. SJ17W-69 TaxID=3421657 RepID=UPI003EBCEB8B